MIRITGGLNRSRLLSTPDSNLTKPTMDKVRLGVFSALGDLVVNSKVLDLFAGSGSYGFESLSRGASYSTFVDKSLQANKCLKENKENLKVSNCEIIYQDSLSYLNECSDKFDIIFVDPPYKEDIYEEIVDIIYNKELLRSNGALVLETERELNIDETKFKSVRFYKYGLAKIYIIKK